MEDGHEMNGESAAGNSSLVNWQSKFIERYLETHPKRATLVADIGTGKTFTALTLARMLTQNGFIDKVISMSAYDVQRRQWSDLGNLAGIQPTSLLFKDFPGLFGTHVGEWSPEVKSMLIVDDYRFDENSYMELVNQFLAVNPGNRILIVGNRKDTGGKSSALYDFTNGAGSTETYADTTALHRQFFYDLAPFLAPGVPQEISRYSPSVGILRGLQDDLGWVDGLSWREFEKLIAKLLKADGYTVDLMSGTKDGGVDVLATKDMGASGLIRTLWQAKKKSHNKVGIDVVRELSDTCNEFKVSKGFIVTSTYLTRGALARIERDQFILGKVDRNDLNKWIKKTLYGIS